MGKIEDIMVYSKLVILILISFVLLNNSQTTLPVLLQNNPETSIATSSAISGNLFGASRQMAVIATDGYLPGLLAKRKNQIPVYAIINIVTFAFFLVVIGDPVFREASGFPPPRE